MLAFILLVTDPSGRWHPGIGDPTVMGWLTVLAYALAAFFCQRAFVASRYGAEKLRSISADEAHNQKQLSWFWLVACVAMALLGLNKQLDLQTLFTEIGRDLAQSQGWYQERRKYQALFIVTIGLLGGAFAVGAAFLLRRVARRIRLALGGLSALVVFVVVRAASFHHVDILLRSGPIRLNWVLELGGIALVALAAHRAAIPVRSATA
jgi:hypothetical protein